MLTDYITVSGQLHVVRDPSKPEILGRGPAAIYGTSYMQGPILFGSDVTFPSIWATTMFGPLVNEDSPIPAIPGAISAGNDTAINHSPYSISSVGNAAILNHCDVNLDVAAGRNLKAGNGVIARGNVKSQGGKHTLSRKKNFDIPHPSKDGWRLRHTCPEGPSNDVYIKGRIQNTTEINLPDYWKDFVSIQSLVITLQPIGSHQDIIIKRWDQNKVYLQSKGGTPIDCFYHIFAERIDSEKLIPEYPGNTPADYPGNNEEYSISGYHYDVKEN